MPKVEMDLETSVAPERVRAALLDFTERRPELWPGIEPSLYEVYTVGENTAEVKEGSRMPGMSVWAVEQYEWSHREVVTWTVRRSNFCAPGSYVSAAITPRRDGGSRIHLVWNRTPTTFGARMIAYLIVATNGRPVAGSFRRAMKILEAAPAGGG